MCVSYSDGRGEEMFYSAIQKLRVHLVALLEPQ